MAYSEEPENSQNIDSEMTEAAKREEIRGRWLDEIKKSGERQKDWEERAQAVVDRYRDDRQSSFSESKRFNILWSNTETLKPALYSETPVPMVSRRFKDQDPLGRSVAEILERSTEYQLDTHDFDETVKKCVEDYLLPGRAVPKLVYKPVFGEVIDQDENGDDVRSLDFEETYFKYYLWKDFRHGKARTWEEVPWIAFRNYLTKKQIEERFGEYELSDGYDTKEKNTPEKTIPIWEIWDKRGRKVCFVSEECNVFDRDDPPLDLKGFWPCPKPLYAVSTNNTLEPVPEYVLYQDQANEIDELTIRINLLVKSLKVGGVYDASIGELQTLVDGSEENTLIGVDSWAAFSEKGGLRGVIDFLPMREIAQVVIDLYNAREQTKQELYEITGLADIIRGSSQAQETATAQRIKGQFASLRLRDRQKQVQIFIRDCIRLLTETIAEHFSPETLSLMTNQPVTDEMVQLMRNQYYRDFKVDIETDSTLEPDEQADKQARVEFIETTGAFIERMLPLAQTSPALAPFIGEILLFGVRGFRTGRELEESLEQALQAMANQPQAESQPDPKEQAEAAKIQQDMQLDQAGFQRDTQKMLADEKRDQESHIVDMQTKLIGG